MTTPEQTVNKTLPPFEIEVTFKHVIFAKSAEDAERFLKQWHNLNTSAVDIINIYTTELKSQSQGKVSGGYTDVDTQQQLSSKRTNTSCR